MCGSYSTAMRKRSSVPFGTTEWDLMRRLASKNEATGAWGLLELKNDSVPLAELCTLSQNQEAGPSYA